MNTKLVKFEREAHPYKLTLMVDNSIYGILKKYSKDYNVTMSSLVEALVYSHLKEGDSNAITN